MTERIWVFNGNHNHFPSGVFSTRAQAEAWIAEHGLSGTLTAYPLDRGSYQWAIAQGHFTPCKPHHATPDFIANFSSAHQEHYHYYKGLSGKAATALAAAEAVAEQNEDALLNRYPRRPETP